MKQRLIILLLILLLFMGATASLWSQSTTQLGRLVFTDIPANGRYTIDVFDLDTNERYSLEGESYKNIGSIANIDDNQVFLNACFARNNPMFCSANVEEIVSRDSLSKYEPIMQMWQENYGNPIWSPDGNHIAFISMNKIASTVYQGDPYMMNADGTNVFDLTPDEYNNGFTLSWSPDSRHVAFACYNEQYLCVVNVDGSNLRQFNVTENVRVRHVAWSPTANQIIFSALDREYHNSELHVFDLDTFDRVRLLDAGPNFHESPVWSPDGSKIVFRSGEQNNNVGEIYVINSDGTDLHNLSHSLDGSEFGAVWSPDGAEVAFFSYRSRDKETFLYISNANGSDLRKITDNAMLENLDVGSPIVFWIP